MGIKGMINNWFVNILYNNNNNNNNNNVYF